MKIKIGGKYKMRNYPTEYKYVHILGRVGDILPDQAIVNDKVEYYGVVVYEHGVRNLGYDPNLGAWGEDGSWDSTFLNDNNAIVSEYQDE